MTTNTNNWCFAWYQGPPAVTSEAKAGLVKDNKWNDSATIRIGFMDGTPAQQALVRKFAEGWIEPGLANLKFSWGPVNVADIRISFAYAGSWSVIGTSCKNVPKGQPTMNFGWLTDDVTDAEAQRVILHEFGHALGLIHEHQSPLGQIKWNKPAVYDDLKGPSNCWNKDTIDHNMFEAYPRDEIDGTKIDKTSIMMYPIPASWVTDPSQAVGLNSTLSTTDKAFIKKAYP